MDLKKYVPNCPVCGEKMTPFWREVGDTQKYKCENCMKSGLLVRTYITQEEGANEIRSLASDST